MIAWNSNYKTVQGNIGLGRAIDYYTSTGCTVFLPLNDTLCYDLIIEKNSKLYKVSVKTSCFKRKNSNYYSVLLKKCGGSSGKTKIKNFDNTKIDILFVLTIDDQMYEIPSTEINVKTSLVLTDKWNKFKINFYGSSAFLETKNVEVG